MIAGMYGILDAGIDFFKHPTKGGAAKTVVTVGAVFANKIPYVGTAASIEIEYFNYSETGTQFYQWIDKKR